MLIVICCCVYCCCCCCCVYCVFVSIIVAIVVVSVVLLYLLLLLLLLCLLCCCVCCCCYCCCVYCVVVIVVVHVELFGDQVVLLVRCCFSSLLSIYVGPLLISFVILIAFLQRSNSKVQILIIKVMLHYSCCYHLRFLIRPQINLLLY